MTDETLYRLFFEGEQEAAKTLLERHGEKLTLYLHGVIHDMPDAEDLMVEAFSQLFRKRRSIHREGDFKAYLYKTGRNLALRHLKKNRLSFLSLSEPDFEVREEALADTALYEQERNQQLYAAMEKLNGEYREALYLLYFDELSYAEAAAVLGKTVKQIDNLCARGKRQLKLILEQEGFSYADYGG